MYHWIKLGILIFFITLGIQGLYGQDDAKEQWVNNTLSGLTLDQKIGQLFMIRAHSDKGKEHTDQVEKYIRDYQVGGLCFFQGTPQKQAELTNIYQQKSNIPLMVAMDAEWGLGMRMPATTISYPRQLMLGAIKDDNIIYEMGKEIARELKRIGVQVNFAPVTDVNNNPLNPVINDRSFGEDVMNVSAKSYQYMKGMQDNGVLACMKHFPGHGDTDVDSHYDLPLISHSRGRLDSVELVPMRMLAEQGVGSVMVAHLQIPALDDRPNRPTTLSKYVVTALLQKELGYKGLIFTDGMEMQGVTKYFKDGEAELEAFLAGNDMILLPVDLAKAINLIKKNINSGQITMERLDHSVRKILASKYDLGLNHKPFVDNISGIDADINGTEGLVLKSRLVEQSLTIAANDKGLLPIKDLNKNFHCITIGCKDNTFEDRVKDYVDTGISRLSATPSREEVNLVIKKVKAESIVIVAIGDMSKYGNKNYGINEEEIYLIESLLKSNDVILTLLGSPYSLKYFENVPSIMMAYNDDNLTQDLAVQGLFGANEVSGTLPVTASPKFKVGQSIYTPNLGRLGFSIPEVVGLSSTGLAVIDSLADDLIKVKAAPGCQVLVAKNGNIVWNKSYGHHTYDSPRQVKSTDVYDLASVTKILASTISVMKLYDEGKLSIYQPIKKYLPEAEQSNKGNIILGDLMTHHAGLKGWIPFYIETLEEDGKALKPATKYYRNASVDSFEIQVANGLYMRDDYADTMWCNILTCDLRDRRDYRYSDLGFYIIHNAIKNVTGQRIDEYARNTFYRPLGLRTTGYLPLQTIDKDRIPPTEKDDYFRKQDIQGYVHDMGAAMLGGVSGHAGLFSDAQDLAVIMQMLLNGGSYGGVNYIKPSTIKRFTTRYYRSTRRGIGFDMKELNADRHLNMSELASDNTYGHLGFTGTAVFTDPDEDIIFIFLSNRTYPIMKNNRLGDKDYRPKIQSVIYNSLLKPKTYPEVPHG